MKVTPTRDWNVFARAPDAADDGYLGCDIAIEMHAQVTAHVRDTFPINEVPDAIVDALNEVEKAAEQCAAISTKLGRMMLQHCGQVQEVKVTPLMHFGFGRGSSFAGSLCGSDGLMTKTNAETTCPQCIKLLADTADKDR